MKELSEIVARVRERPRTAWALATLVETEGSTYRQPGACLLADATGETCLGVLSGGCLEEEIAVQAAEIIHGAAPRLLTFDTRRLFGCEGLVRILLERVPPLAEGGNLLDAVGRSIEQRKHCRVATRYRGDSLGSRVLAGDALVVENPNTFVHEVPLPLRLLLFGSGPEITPTRQIASTLGWHVNAYHLPDELPLDFRPDQQTAALVMTHHFGRDLAALDRLLPLGLRYLGLLGPRKRQRQLLAELSELRRLDPVALAALHSPAGLDIGSEAPEEIALSITSEICAVLAGRSGGALRDRATPIHLASAAQQVA